MPRKKQDSNPPPQFTTRWRPGKRGIKASKFQFTEEQEKILYEYGHDLEENIAAISKGMPLKKNSHVTAWKKEKAIEIFELSTFKSLDKSRHSSGGWLTGITAWLTNYYNRYISKGGDAAARPSKSVPASDKVLRSLALFLGDLSPKEYYAQENAALLKERSREILKHRGESDKLPPGAARNIALAELWDELTTAEKNHWKERAHSLAEDVERNQEDFPLLITDALQSICDRGRLGTVVMALNYGYRDAKGMLECGCLYAGANSETGQRLNVKINGHDEWVAQWRTYADQTIPLPRPAQPSLIDKDIDGAPKLPDIDINRSSPLDISSMLEEYITALWDRASPASRGISRVLWTAIEKDPDMFYDTEQFHLPCPLKPASELIADRSKVYALAEYFLDLRDSGRQFLFYQREEHASDSENEDSGDEESTPVPVRKDMQRKKASPPPSESDENENPLDQKERAGTSGGYESSGDESLPLRRVTHGKTRRVVLDEEEENPFDDHQSEDEHGRPSSSIMAATVAQFAAAVAKLQPPPPTVETAYAPDVTPTPLSRESKKRNGRRPPTPPTRELRSRARVANTNTSEPTADDTEAPPPADTEEVRSARDAPTTMLNEETVEAPEAPGVLAPGQRKKAKAKTAVVDPNAAGDTGGDLGKKRKLTAETVETTQAASASAGALRKKAKASKDVAVPAGGAPKKKRLQKGG